MGSDRSCDQRQRALFGISIVVAVLMAIVSVYVLGMKVYKHKDGVDGTTDNHIEARGAPSGKCRIDQQAGLKENWVHLTTSVSVLIASLVSALQSVADCDL